MKLTCDICGDNMIYLLTKDLWCCPRMTDPYGEHPPLPNKNSFSFRKELLDEAKEIITQDRNNSYGDPDQDFKRIADYWNLFLNDGLPNSEEVNLIGADVAVMMILLKIARLTWNPTHKDSWLDIAGYAACGYETMELNKNA